VLQTIAPALSFARATSTVPLTGGTHVPCSPCFRYLPLHRLHYMRRIGFNLQLGLKVAGFYSRGGGPIRAVIQWNQALKRLREVPKATEIEILCLSSSSQGTFLLLLCQYGFQSLGTRGKPTKRVSDEAVAELLDFLTTDGAVFFPINLYCLSRLPVEFLSSGRQRSHCTSRRRKPSEYSFPSIWKSKGR